MPVALAAAALAVVAPAATAHANSCQAEASTITPHAGTVGVPTNTRIWIVGPTLDLYGADGQGQLCDDPPRLLDDQGAQVVTSLERLGQVVVLTPAQPLTQGSTYVVEHGCIDAEPLDDDDPMSPASTRFTVDAPADDEPPPLPDVAVDAPVVQGDRVSIEVQGEFDRILVVDIGSEAMLDPAGPSGTVSTASIAAEFSLGNVGCATTWPTVRPGVSTTLNFGAFDLAGNFSGWTEAEPLDVESQGCACRATPGGGPRGWMALVLLGLLCRRRHTAAGRRHR